MKSGERDYMGSFLTVTRAYFRGFERANDGFTGETADIIRLIWFPLVLS